MEVSKWLIIVFIGIITVLNSCQSAGHVPETIYMNPGDSSKHVISLWSANTPVKGMVVILPPYGGDNNYYANSKLISLFLKYEIAFATIYSGSTGYHDDVDILALDSMMQVVIEKNNIPKDKIVLGGFSAGGYGALRYAIFSKSGKHKLGITPAGLFSVDAPLDLERWYNGMELFLQRADSTNIMYGEANYMTWKFRNMYKGSPKENLAAYRENSVVSIFTADGGNAWYLKDYPIRLYTEPDINWYIENVRADYLSINAIDQAALINILKLAGNKKATLITTTGKGYRPEFNNARIPHSWSIVDEDDFGKWVIDLIIKKQ